MPPWYWVALTAIVRLLFVVAPFLGVRREFAFSNDLFREVKDFSRASACKAMLLSFPALQLINLLAKTGKDCGNVGLAPFLVAVIFCLCCVLGVGLYFIPAWVYRGKRNSIFWVAGLTIADVILTVTVIPNYDNLLCNR